MKLLVKNMVCRHCVATVARVLEQIPGVVVEAVELGYAVVSGTPSDTVMEEIRQALADEGFELIQSRDTMIAERIKQLLIGYVRHSFDYDDSVTVSDLLSRELGMSYSAISRLFSVSEGRTIENYLMNLRVERVKELIRYRQMSLAEIADEAGYSSVAHLSRMFKRITGMTPSEFRSIGSRKPLPEV